MQPTSFSLTAFTPTSTLSKNITEKRIVLLGTMPSHPDAEAIVILNPKAPITTPSTYTQITPIFQNDIYSRYDVKFEGEY